MSIAETDEMADVLGRVANWSPSLRIALARRILETLEAPRASQPPRAKSLRDLAGLLKTDDPPPTDEECRKILEEELIKKHLK